MSLARALLCGLGDSSIVPVAPEARWSLERLDLPRFGGHLISWEKGVHDVAYTSALSIRVQGADGRAGSLGPLAGGMAREPGRVRRSFLDPGGSLLPGRSLHEGGDALPVAARRLRIERGPHATSRCFRPRTKPKPLQSRLGRLGHAIAHPGLGQDVGRLRRIVAELVAELLHVGAHDVRAGAARSPTPGGAGLRGSRPVPA